MAAKKKPPSKEELQSKLTKLLTLAAMSDSQHERHSTIDKVHAFMVKHDLKTDALSPQAPPSPPAAGLDQAAAKAYAAANSVRSAAETVRSVATDPHVQKGINGLVDVASAVRDIFGARKS